jgi:hypothetical protein
MVISLGDVDESTIHACFEALLDEGKVRRFAEIKAAWSFVQPILAANPGWKWRDAAKWMHANGKAAEAEAAYRAAGDEIERIGRIAAEETERHRASDGEVDEAARNEAMRARLTPEQQEVLMKYSIERVLRQIELTDEIRGNATEH